MHSHVVKTGSNYGLNEEVNMSLNYYSDEVLQVLYIDRYYRSKEECISNALIGRNLHLSININHALVHNLIDETW